MSSDSSVPMRIATSCSSQRSGSAIATRIAQRKKKRAGGLRDSSQDPSSFAGEARSSSRRLDAAGEDVLASAGLSAPAESESHAQGGGRVRVLRLHGLLQVLRLLLEGSGVLPHVSRRLRAVGPGARRSADLSPSLGESSPGGSTPSLTHGWAR